MSAENAKAFLQELGQDKVLQQKFEAANNDGRLKLAHSLGMDFSPDELMEVLNKSQIQEAEELTDSDLASVSGGFNIGGLTRPPVTLPGPLAGAVAAVACASGMSPTFNINNTANITINIS